MITAALLNLSNFYQNTRRMVSRRIHSTYNIKHEQLYMNITMDCGHIVHHMAWKKDHLNVHFAKNKQLYKEYIFHLHYTVYPHEGSQSKHGASIQKKKKQKNPYLPTHCQAPWVVLVQTEIFLSVAQMSHVKSKSADSAV